MMSVAIKGIYQEATRPSIDEGKGNGQPQGHVEETMDSVSHLFQY